MSLYIPDIKLPPDGTFDLFISINHEGIVRDPWGNLITDGKAIEVPPHGRLVDAEEFYERVEMDDKSTMPEVMHIHSILGETKTIIPAEGGETK